jgi:prepilin-type N-terminal cleavage/methylation domain
MKFRFPRFSRRAFTLIELLTVIAVVGILAAILVPTVGRVRENARASQCRSNLRQIGMAYSLYADANRGMFPKKTAASAFDSMLSVVTVDMLPYIAHPLPPNDGTKLLFSEPWRCPSGPETWQTTYSPNNNHWAINLRKIQNPSRFALYWDRGGTTASAPGTQTPGAAWHGNDRYNAVFADSHVESLGLEALKRRMLFVEQ